MTTYIIRRMFEAIPVLLGVSILVFLFVHIIPGDPALTLLGERASPERVEEIRNRLGLNKPLFLNFEGSSLELTRESTPLVGEPDNDEVIGELKPGDTITIRSREGDWVNVQAVERQEFKGWVQDDKATVNGLEVTFSEERMRAVDEPLERGAKRLGSIPVSDLTVVSVGEDGWFEVTWVREENKRTGWVRVEDVKLIINPLDSQYFRYMGRILTGDLGNTIQGNIPIMSELRRRLPATIELSLCALFLATIIGVPVGVISAVKRNSLIDTASMMSALIGVSMPIFWLGLVFIFFFSIQLQVLPMVGRLDIDTHLTTITGLHTVDALLTLNWSALVDAIRHLIMPSIVLSTVPVSIIARITRSSMLEVLNQDYVRAARAKGVRERIVINKHALRNALLPVVTVIGLQLGILLSGAVLTETIFTWPGIGRWLFENILKREYPIIQSVTLVIAFIFVTVNLLVDLSYSVLDPRIRLR